VAAVVLLGGACSDDGGEAEPPDAGQTTAGADEDVAAIFERDACELMTEEQAVELLGEGAWSYSTDGEAEISQPSSCSWSAADSSVDLGDPHLTAIAIGLGDRQIYENTRVQAEDGDTYEELDGIGDEAFAGDASGGVVVGDMGITVYPLGTDANDPATHDLVVELVGIVAQNA
jgi:hypothetical protein